MCCVLSRCLPVVTTCICVFCSVLLPTVSCFWEATLPAMHRWGLSTSNGHFYLTQWPPPCSLTPHKWLPLWTITSFKIACSDITPATATVLFLTPYGCSCVAPYCVKQQLAMRTQWSVIKTICHSCPGEKDAPSRAKEAPEGPPSPG